MPHSTHHPISSVLEHVVRMAPQSVLDVGIGYGKWGFLIRESLDWLADRHDRASWQTKIDGLEVFPDYRSPLYDWVYDQVTYGNVVDVAADLPAYDLVMLGDVLEHLDKQTGLRVLRTLLARSRNVIVSTPVDFFTQEILGNPYEAHLSVWSIADFGEWVFDYSVQGHTAVVVALAGRDASYPTLSDRRASQWAYRLPGMRVQGAGAVVVKRLATRLQRRRPPSGT